MFALRLKELRENKRLSQQAFANRLNISQSAVGMWESGKREPNFETITTIAAFFDVPVDYLLGTSNVSSIRPQGTQIPVLGTVVAGIPIEAIQDIIDYEEIDYAMSQRGEYFGLKIKGSSMEPKISENDVVIVRKQENVENGDIAIVMVNGDEATCKKVSKQPSGITLIPLNPSYEPIFYSNEEINTLPIRILGKVVELRAKF